jgi:hypothetical protein
MLSANANADDLARLAAFPLEFRLAVRRGAWSFVARAASYLKDHAPAATGNLRNSIMPSTNTNGGTVSISANYSGLVHEGRPAGSVNASAIKDWAKAKGLPDGAWIAIARSIEKRGTKGQPWVRDFIRSTDLQNMLKKSIGDALE